MYKHLYDDMKNNSYPPNKRFLTIMACHTNSKLKLDSTVNNLSYLSFENNDIVIINSDEAEYGDQLKASLTSFPSIITIPNDTSCDFGKWVHILKLYGDDISKYDYVVFINDSIVIKSSIKHFFNIMANKSVELYGYNDSTEIRHHYQSYLFGISSKSCYKLIDMLNNNRHLINTFYDLICNMELPLIDTFSSHDCFIKVGNHPENVGKNIYFENDTLYNRLFYNQLLPFVKIKRMIR
jgi:hypothetical protein